jgi:hypothetical protein
MLEALESAESKLREYYGRTDDNELSDIYAHGTILAPQHKLEFFRTKDWTGDYATAYLESLQGRVKAYQTDTHLLSIPQASVQTSALDKMLATTTESAQKQDELTRYLQAGKLLA